MSLKQSISIKEIFDTKGMKKKKEYTGASKIDSYMEGQKVSNNSLDKETENNNILTDSILSKETNVGKKLSDLTTKRVVIIVLLIMISIPIFD